MNSGELSRRVFLRCGVAGAVAGSIPVQAASDPLPTELKPALDKLAGQPWKESATGFPVITTGIAWMDCAVDALHFAGDHVLALARVTGGDVLDPRAIPLLYRDTGNIDGSAALFPPSFPVA